MPGMLEMFLGCPSCIFENEKKAQRLPVLRLLEGEAGIFKPTSASARMKSFTTEAQRSQSKDGGKIVAE